jgi:hypothetical protein
MKLRPEKVGSGDHCRERAAVKESQEPTMDGKQDPGKNISVSL